MDIESAPLSRVCVLAALPPSRLPAVVDGVERWGSLLVGPSLAASRYGAAGSATVFALDEALVRADADRPPFAAAIAGLTAPGTIIAAGALINVVLIAIVLTRPWLRAVD